MVWGEDPLTVFGPNLAAQLRRISGYDNAGDLLVNSFYDPATGEVAAFEELIGCHGGLGGWQSRSMLVHPAAWPVTEELIGADAVHRQLVRWRERLISGAGSAGTPDPPRGGAGAPR